MSNSREYKNYILSNIQEYRDYQKKAFENEPYMTLALKELLPDWMETDQPLSLLDIGCGNGNTMFHLNRKWPHWGYTGLDVVPNLIEDGRALFAEHENFRLEVGDAEELADEFAGNFDIVLVWRVVNTLLDREGAIRSAWECVKPGGRLIMSLHINIADVGITLAMHDYNSADSGKSVPFHVFAKSEFEEICGRIGITNLEMTPFNMPADIPKPEKGLNTHTILLEDGHRLQVAGGALVDHWKIVCARKELA